MKSFYFAIFTAILWGIVPAFEKIGLSKLSPQAGIFIRCLAVSLGSLTLFIFKPDVVGEIAKTPFKYISLIILGGFTANFLGQLLFYNALKNGDVSRVVPVAGAYPLISFILGILILGEKLTVMKSFGIVCILAGVLLLK
ncbi:MAG TPA: EamA family transporter [Candidatus Omnitrophota bacterium]|nr:EamA family transporter [Candidatus Omnitrophota bacterium]